MIKLFIKKWISDCEKTEDLSVRGAYGTLAGILGIICNFILFFLKLLAGVRGRSMAILSDAFNNLSDMGSSVVSLIAVTASNRHADEEHPFGHGRFEYIASLIVSFIIMLVGFELLKTSFDKILHFEKALWHPLGLIILLVSVLVKLWMFSYNKYIGKKIQSMVILASAQDSLNDVYATLAVAVSTLLAPFVHFPLDGIMGFLISLLIMYTGFNIAKETVGVLLGQAPDPAVAEKISAIILSCEGIQGVHDLILHDYGPGRCMGSVHAEVPMDGDIVRIHEVIDAVEKQIQKELGVHMVIHMDPISVDSEHIRQLRDLALGCAKKVNPSFGLHDFRMTEGERCINLIFDLEVPYCLKPEERQKAVEEIQCLLAEEDGRLNAVIEVDNKICAD